MNRLGSLAGWCARRRVAVLALTATTLLLLGGGMLRLTFDDDPLDAMPRGNPHTEATEELVARFPGSSYAASVYFTVDPERWERENAKLPNRVPLDEAGMDRQYQAVASMNQVLQGPAEQERSAPAPVPGPHNITDEVYQRAMEAYFQHLIEDIPEMRWGITLPSQVKLINFTNTGVPAVQPPDAAAFALPGTDPEGAYQYSSAWNTYWMSSPASIRSIVSLDWTTTRMGLLSQPGDLSLAEMGDLVYDSTERFKDRIRACDLAEATGEGACDLAFNAFSPDAIIVDPRAPVTMASYLTEVSLEDALRLAPIAGAFIATSLWLAFRRIGTVAAMLVPMGFAGVGVLGMFGLIGLPIHSVSLLVFPILMGNGIDFAIHMAQAYHRARGDGADAVSAAEAAGREAGTPLFVATLTTVAGMLLLVFAPNTLLAELGTAILMGMVILLAVSLTSLPAMLSFTTPAPRRAGPMGRSLVANARFWNRRRALGGGIALVLAAASIAGASGLQTLIVGTPAAFFPPGDPQREDFERSGELYYTGQENLVTSALVLQGDLVTPEAMDFMADLEQSLADLPFVKPETALTLRFAVNGWIQVRDGTAGAPAVIAQEAAAPGSTFPDDREGIKELVDEMFDGPLATYASFFVAAPDYTIGSALVEIYQAEDFAGLEAQWLELLATVEEVKQRNPGHGLDVHVAGSTAVAYLFTKEEMPYLQVAGIAGIAMTGLLVLVIRRDLRDAVTVAAVVGAAGVWWLGGLALFDIPLSIALVVPVVLIAAIGSDYALHLRYALAKEGVNAWTTVGRAVVYSAITDIGAFLVFTQMRYGLLRDATVATALALACSLLAATLVVPILASRAEHRDDKSVHNDYSRSVAVPGLPSLKP